jgi:hypothetical protein
LLVDGRWSQLMQRSSTPDPSPRWRERAVFGMTHFLETNLF